MKQTRLIMGMPVTVEIVDSNVKIRDFKEVFDYFRFVDKRFSTYKKTSEISQINEGALSVGQASKDMQEIFSLAEATKQETNGYFDISRDGFIDPSGIVKGWAIQNAAHLLEKKGLRNFFVDAGGDIQVSGFNKENKQWTVGIRNPFNREELVKVLHVEDVGVATSGTAIRGQHIYNPKGGDEIVDIVSLTVIASSIYDADRFATAAFAMGKEGIVFIDSQNGLEGYMIDREGIATMTHGFEKYEIH